MTEYIEFHPDNPPPEHVSHQWVPFGEWTDIPGFDEQHTLQVMYEGPTDLARLQLLLVCPGKIEWYPNVPARWFSKVDAGEPQDESDGVGVKMTFGEEPEGHAHSGPGPCPAEDCEWRP